MIIAVSMRVVNNPTYPEVRDALSHEWIRALSKLGVVPVPVPNVLPDPVAYVWTVGAKGLVLSGGEDLGPIGGEDGAEEPPSPRDRTERALLQGALAAGLPVFGVCRGMQFINVLFGGSLARSLMEESPQAKMHAGVSHEVEIVESRMQVLAGVKRVVTNSYHNQGVTLRRLAPSLRAFALADDGVVEGLLHPGRPVLGVQWHPERENAAAEFDTRLLGYWLSQCASSFWRGDRAPGCGR